SAGRSENRGYNCPRSPFYFPFVFVLILARLWSAAMYSTLPSSPQLRFAVATPVLSVPRCLPTGEKTWMPPGPVAHRLPSLSTLIPSGKPGRFMDTQFVVSKQLASRLLRRTLERCQAGSRVFLKDRVFAPSQVAALRTGLRTLQADELSPHD